MTRPPEKTGSGSAGAPSETPPRTEPGTAPGTAPQSSDETARQIARRAERMKAARDHPGPSPLWGIGTFGMIGWSIAVPTVLGAFLGLWLDRIAPRDGFSWTLALILGGVAIGSMVAWSWVNKEGGRK